MTTLPEATAEEWVYEDEGEDNSDYPADARVVVVVHTPDVEYALSHWNRYTSLSPSELEEAGTLYYAFPAPRLVRDKECPNAPEIQRARAESESDKLDGSSDDQPFASTLTDIQHVGESRAENLRAAGYESVADVAAVDTSAVAEIDGIGGARAETITTSAADVLDDQPGGSEPDAPKETATDIPESRETTDETDPSAAIVALSRFLNSNSTPTAIVDDGQSVRVTKADISYRVSLESGVEGDGPHRAQLEETVEKVRAATEETNQ